MNIHSRTASAAISFALSAAVLAASCTKSGEEDHSTHNHNGGEHSCDQPYAVDPRDATMSGEIVHLVTDAGDPDDPSDDVYEVVLPQAMVDWLNENNWVQEHGDWHNVRRWDMGCMQSGTDDCPSAKAMEARGLKRAPIQEGEPGDGYAFLVMHRHMIRGFKEAFPKHADILRGFEHVPLSKDDPENPIPWVDVHWSEEQLASIELLQDIEHNLDLFESEDDLGNWIQLLPIGQGFPPGGFPDGGFPDGGFPGFPGAGGGGQGGGGQGGAGGSGGLGGGGSGGAGGSGGRPGGGIHGGLHGQWAVPGSPYFLGDNNVNLPVLAFWRLHSWIDDIWERYRVAKGIREDDATYKAEILAQCEEMHTLGLAKKPDDGPTTNETGVFAEKVAPVFKAYCAGCHDAVGASKGLVLSGAAPSKMREGLVGVKATEVDMLLVDPGSPNTSWLMRKLTGDFSGMACTECKTTMPPAGGKPKDEEVQTIRAWIEAGATAD